MKNDRQNLENVWNMNKVKKSIEFKVTQYLHHMGMVGYDNSSCRLLCHINTYIIISQA